MIILSIILFLILCSSVYVNWNLLRKIEVLEDANEETGIWIDNYKKSLVDILMTMRDDEVGQSFKSILKTIESLEELNIDKTT